MNNLDYILYWLSGLEIIVLTLVSTLVFICYYLFKTLRILNATVDKMVNFSDRDPLTGLPNRTQFFENFKKTLAEATQHQKQLALLFLDIDNFRGIKDSLGYAVGDALLLATAKRLLSIMNNKRECLARLASDQFTIVIEYEHEDKKNYQKIEEILHIFSEPFLLLGQEVTTTASIGISIFPKDGNTADRLLKNAGIARYQAKKLGNNTYSFYTEDMNIKLSQDNSIVDHLRKAIENKEFVVCYQPKVDARTRKIVGAEALLQWNNSALGKVSPAQFIPLAEQTGLIVSIGNWVLTEACTQAKKWHDQGFRDFSIAVNLSAYQFKTGDIAEKVAATLWDSKLGPEFLELEITESMMMENVEKSLLMLRVLKSMGIPISIDDFGTGYSSLSQLRKFPINALKIDQSFVKNIKNKAKELDDSAVIITIIAMAKQLGIKIIAEGVETEEQFEFLKKEGCDLIQGYLFSKPIPAEDFLKLMSENWKRQ